MPKWNSRPFLVVVASVGVLAYAHAAGPVLAPISPVLQKSQTLAPMVAIQPPAISSLQHGGSCVAKGGGVTVLGSNFGTQSGRSVALGGGGLHIDLPVASWGSTSIAVTIPNNPSIKAGASYYIGIEKSDHSQWLSNINRTIPICAAAPAAVVAPLNAPLLPAILSGGGAPPPPPPPSGAAPTGSEYEPEPDYAPEYGAPMAPMPPAGGGSLLQTGLPPPPEDLPAPPPKEDKTIEPGELVVVSGSMAEAQKLAMQAQTLGLGVKRRTNLPGLGFVVTVLRVPKDVGVGNALSAMRQSQPQAWVDANHRFALQGDDPVNYARRLIGAEKVSPFCGTGIRIGILDTAPDSAHPTLRGRDIVSRSFLAAGVPLAASGHGTAVAALLIGNPQPSGFGGLVPAAKLYVANIFRAQGKESETTAEWIVQALDWLAQQHIQVVNLSLGGPRNLLVEAAVERIMALGIPVVAAAGNSGPNAAPVFPAAQNGVIAVTAVDAELKPWKKANRGEYLGFAAPGVDVWSAAPGQDGAYYSGTSYATPFITAAMASERQKNPKASWQASQQRLQKQSRDLGAPGKDPVFGWGLVQTLGCR